MAKNRGTQFEYQIRQDFNKIKDVSCLRLNDNMGGYSGVAGFCDFVVYKYPCQYFIECKTTHAKNFPLENISKRQWEGLLKMRDIKGVNCGVIIWFIAYGKTLYIDIQLLNYLKSLGWKSINPTVLHDYSQTNIYGFLKDYIIEIPAKKKKVLYTYDLEAIFDGKHI